MGFFIFLGFICICIFGVFLAFALAKVEKKGPLTELEKLIARGPIAQHYEQPKPKLPYRPRKYLFSQAERSFLGVLEKCLGPELKIYAKVRLADVFLVGKETGRNWRIDFSKIAQKHVDFLIVDEKGRQPIAGVELDDSSHEEEDRMERDKFVDQVFESAGLPIVHVPASYTYSTEKISAMLLGKIPSLTR